MNLIGFKCGACRTLFKLVPDKENPALYVEKFLSGPWKCPCCGEGPLLPTVVLDAEYRAVDVTPHQLWNAVHGLGLPGEEATEQGVRSLFLEHQITDVAVAAEGFGRVSVTWIQFDTGSRIYFGVSAGQAIIYKITHEEGRQHADQEIRPR